MAIFNSSLQIDIKQNKKIMLAAAIYHENLNFRNPALINGIRLVLLRFFKNSVRFKVKNAIMQT
jgi:hypothetical protein